MAAVLAGGVRLFARRPFPQPGSSDVLLLGLGTFKLSRLITKDKVLLPIRQPFVSDIEPGEGPEVNSKPGGSGVRRAVGELLTCPFCISVWIATVLTAAYALAPQAARIVASGLSALVVADVSQYLYTDLRKVAK
jgi:Protein of unknown function (DUF1360)